MKHRTISRRLTIMNMVVSGAALLFAGIVLFAYDWITFRQTLVQHLSIQAEIIGFDTVSALLFNDPDAADRTLAALRADHNVTSAVIVTADALPFASYSRDTAESNTAIPPMPPGKTEAYAFADGELALARRIISDGKTIGTICIRSDLRELSERIARYTTIILIVFIAASLAALLVSSLSKRAISEPIVQLAEITRTVSREKDYSLRALPKGSSREVSALIEGFNEMLSQIQERDKALELGRAELERRVQERTAQLEAANKELEAFSYSVSHDLRAPLRHIDGFSTLLAQKYGRSLDPGALRYLTFVQDAAKQMGQLIDDLLNMGRITRKEMALISTDLNSILQSVLKEIGSEAEPHRIEWRLTPLPTLECDPGLMKVVFTNLVSNAVKYSRHAVQPVIEIGQYLENGTRIVFVKDNGAGFEQQYSHKLFGVFQRLHRSDDFEGTGVGLATVHRIIQRHGGKIWAQGEVDKGATFFFTLDRLA